MSGLTPFFAASISSPVRMASSSVSSRAFIRSAFGRVSSYATTARLKAALQICPTREEKVSRTVSKRARQSLASDSRAETEGIFSRGRFRR